MSWIVTWNIGSSAQKRSVSASVAVWLNGDAPRVLNCTTAQTAAARRCHFGPGGVVPWPLCLGCRVIAFLHRGYSCFVIGSCGLKQGKSHFVARPGCFSASPVSADCFSEALYPASQRSPWYWRILYSVHPTGKKNGLLFIKTHFPSETPFPSLFISTYEAY